MERTWQLRADGVENPAVLHFEGAEEIARPYRFTIEFDSPKVDVPAALEGAASLSFREPGARPGEFIRTRFPGVVSSLEHLGGNRYRLELVPRLWRLGLRQQSRVFVARTVPEILKEVLEGGGLSVKIGGRPGEADAVLQLHGTYPSRDFTVQFQESDLDFLHRTLEHEGIAYYFDFRDDKDWLVLTDRSDFPPIRGSEVVAAREPRAVARLDEEFVHHFAGRQKLVPSEVVLNDYNYLTPTEDLTVTSPVVARASFGQTYEFGNNYRDDGEGGRYAEIRSQEILCRRRTFSGKSTVLRFRAGRLFVLSGVEGPAGLNALYLIARVRHVGHESADAPTYSNEFDALAGDLPFRPERRAPVPRMAGIHYGKVHGQGGGDGAPIDAMGRYHVADPSLSSRLDDEGPPSLPVPRGQPYVGEDYGMHFPLHPGNDVLLGYIEGDANRPIVIQALPNPQKGSPVKGGNPTQCVIKTGAQNQICFENTGGGEWCRVDTPSGATHALFGASDGVCPPGVVLGTERTVSINAGQGVCVSAGGPNHAAGVSSGSGLVSQVTSLASTCDKIGMVSGGIVPAVTALGMKGLGDAGGVLGASGGGVTAPDAHVSAKGHATLVGLGAALAATSAFAVSAALKNHIIGVLAAQITAGESVGVIAGRTVRITALFKGVAIRAPQNDIHIRARRSVRIEAKRDDVSLSAALTAIRAEARRDFSLTAQEGQLTIESKQELALSSGQPEKVELKAGNSTITLTKEQIEFKADKIVVVTENGDGGVELDQKADPVMKLTSKKDLIVKAAKKAKVDGDGSLTLATANDKTVKIKGKKLNTEDVDKVERRHSKES